MSHSRIDRVASQVKEALGNIIDQRLQDPQVPDFVTVHSVKVAKDLRVADVYVTFLNDEDDRSRAEAIAALNRSASFIRGELGRLVRLKYLPALKFHYNPSTHYAADLERIFHKIDRDPQPPPEPEDA